MGSPYLCFLSDIKADTWLVLRGGGWSFALECCKVIAFFFFFFFWLCLLIVCPDTCQREQDSGAVSLALLPKKTNGALCLCFKPRLKYPSSYIFHLKHSANYPARRSVSLCADWEIRHSPPPSRDKLPSPLIFFFPFQTAQRCYGYEWFITMGVSPCVEHFTCVVKMLYNLQFIQALAALSSKFSPEERQAWSSAGALKKVKVKSGGPTHDSVWTSPLFSGVKQTAVIFVRFSLSEAFDCLIWSLFSVVGLYIFSVLLPNC